MKAFSERKKQSLYKLALILLCPIIVNTSVTAEESVISDMPKAESQAEAGEADVFEIDTITVTARKQEENVQDVPMSLSAFSDVMVEESGVKTSSELMRYAPNVYVREAGSNYQTIIRGVTGFENALHSAAGYYINDVNIPLVYMQNPDLLEVERVEVLKGPQGTLYGRNSESGVVNIVTRQPDNTFRGKVFGEVSYYDTDHGDAPGYQAGASFSMPIVKDEFYIGFAGKHTDWDGYIKNEYDNDEKANDTQRTNGHMTLRWTPTETWDVSLLLDTMQGEDGYTYGRIKETTDRLLVNMDAPHFRKQNANTQALRLKHSGSTWDFLSITGHSYYKDEAATDYDMSPLDLYPSEATEEDTLISQEFRLSSSATDQGSLSWLVGTYFFQEDLEVTSKITEDRRTDIDIKGTAVFGQLTYSPLASLHVTVGARYDYHTMDGTQTYTNMSNTTSSFSDDDSRGEFLPKASIAYDLNPEVMIYGTVAKGYLAGGYNFSMATNEETLMYGPEYTWNYEVGMKSNLFDNRLKANLAVFYIDMKDKQVSEVDPVYLATTISNAAEAKSTGFELEVQARPAPGWDIYGGVGYTDTEIEEWVSSEYDSSYNLVEYDYSGNDLPNAPSRTYNIGTQYMHESGFYGRADLFGTGSFYHDAKNTLKESAYEIVNLKAGYMKDQLEINLWCKNLFDTEYYTVQFNWAGMKGVFDGTPRQIGATLTYRL